MHEVSDILVNEHNNGDSEENETSVNGYKFVYCFQGRQFHTNFKKPSSFASKFGSAPLTVSNKNMH